MTWLSDRQLELFREVFDGVDFIPLNRKGNLKLRGLSFFSTDAKSVKQLTNYIIDISEGRELNQPQYVNAVKNSCLVNQDNSLNKFGKLFLNFLRLNDGEALNAIKNSSSIRSIDDKYLLPLEYIILSAVYDNWNCNDRQDVEFTRVIDNINYFLLNVTDTLNESDMTDFDIKSVFRYDNDNFFLMLQGINFQGFEVKRLLRQKDGIDEFQRLYIEAYEHCPKDDSQISPAEKSYFKQILYFKNQFQKDIRYRVKMTLFLSILFEKELFPSSNLCEKIFPTEKEKEDFINENGLRSVLDEKHPDEILRVKSGENKLFYGVPGSGKSQKINDEYGKDESKIMRVVFHPDYMNTDFIGQILPKVDGDGTITYKFTPGPFTKIMDRAFKDPRNMYYLVIEEINRGNAPAIFGDIFQLLDRDENGTSRYFVSNSMVAREMYGDSERQIKIPSNLTILATMNTSDQNVFTLDTAFQRRWSMKMIENRVSEAEHALEKIADSNVTWKAFNEIINERILNSNSTMMSSEDKRLGAYFVTKNDLKDHDAGEFAEKVIKYLWDDAFKFFRDKIFKPSYKSLEEVIIDFSKNKTGNDRFEVFIDEIKDNLIKATQSSGINDGRVLEEEDRTSDEEDTSEVNLQDGDSEEVVHE